MSKGVFVGYLDGATGELVFDAQSYACRRWTVFFCGTSHGSTTWTIWAGDGTDYERLEVFNPANNTWYTRGCSGSSNNLRPYLIEAQFPFYKFVAVGGTPTAGIYMYPGGRR